MHTRAAEEQIRDAIKQGDLHSARSKAYQWLDRWARNLPTHPDQSAIREPALWRCLADVAERTSDQYLIERFWQILDALHPPKHNTPELPLLGIPILNGGDLLERLLNSIDYQVNTLAIVDNSHTSDGQSTEAGLSERLEALRQLGHPRIQHIRIARPFSNLGVAASWNLILSNFPQAPFTLLANHDVIFSPGVIQAAVERINSQRAQLLPLLPSPNSFSAFLLTSLTWDKIGLFDPGFHPAYCEDLDYRDRLRSDQSIEQIDGTFAHEAMSRANQDHSATIRSDPNLAEQNHSSFALNKLWYLSHRRIRQDPRGTWRRLWLNQWNASP